MFSLVNAASGRLRCAGQVRQFRLPGRFLRENRAGKCKKVWKKFGRGARKGQFLLWKQCFWRHKKISQKPIDPGSDFDRFILHPETGEMVRFETSAARFDNDRSIKRASLSQASSGGQNSAVKLRRMDNGRRVDGCRESGFSVTRTEQVGDNELGRPAALSEIFDDIYRNRGAQTRC